MSTPSAESTCARGCFQGVMCVCYKPGQGGAGRGVFSGGLFLSDMCPPGSTCPKLCHHPLPRILLFPPNSWMTGSPSTPAVRCQRYHPFLPLPHQSDQNRDLGSEPGFSMATLSLVHPVLEWHLVHCLCSVSTKSESEPTPWTGKKAAETGRKPFWAEHPSHCEKVFGIIDVKYAPCCFLFFPSVQFCISRNWQ